MQLWGILCSVASNEHNIEVRAVVDLASAQLAQSNNHEGRFFEFVFSQNGFEGVLEAGISEIGEFDQVLLEVSQAEDVTEADTHELGLMITAQPEALVFICVATAQVLQSLFSRFVPAQAATDHQFIDQVRRADGQFGQELGTVEEQEQQVEQGWIARPGLKEHRARTVSADERIEPRYYTVGIGEGGGLRIRVLCRLPAMGKKFQQELHRQFDGARRYMDVSGTVGKLIQEAKRFFHVFE